MAGDVEASIRARHAAGELAAAFEEAMVAYGDELFGFLVGLARDRTRAEDAFGAACERMWRGFAEFRWESSLRAWAYRIARNEFLRGVRARREVPLSQVPSVQQAIARVQSTTPVYARTDVKDRFAEVRAQLDPDDHMLLGLRIDRKLPWAEIAMVLRDGGGPATTAEIAALRKRFERLKARLREAVRGA